MMLASGQVCYGCSKAGTSPLWCSFVVTWLMGQLTSVPTPPSDSPLHHRREGSWLLRMRHTRQSLTGRVQRHRTSGGRFPRPPPLAATEKASKSMAMWAGRLARTHHSHGLRTPQHFRSLVVRCVDALPERCACSRGAIRRRFPYFMRSIEASSLSMLSCDSILSEADLRSSFCRELWYTKYHFRRSAHANARKPTGHYMPHEKRLEGL